jgi:hypothetical protein
LIYPEETFQIETSPESSPAARRVYEQSIEIISVELAFLHLWEIVKLLSSLGLVHIIRLPPHYAPNNQNSD